MIINEKYLQDIDDDDEDEVIPSGNEFNSNKKDLDYDFTVETYNKRMLLQYKNINKKNDVKLCTFGDYIDYYEYVKDIVEDSICVEDCYVRATFSYMRNDYTTDEMDKIPMDTVCEGIQLAVPVILVKFNVYKRTRFKEFYLLLQRLQNCLIQFIKKFDYRHDLYENNKKPQFVLNDFLINEERDVIYESKKIFNSVMKVDDTDDNLPKNLGLKYNGNVRHISPNSEKSVDEFEFGDVLYATMSGELVSQASSDGQKNVPIAICTLSRHKDHRFISLNYMSRMDTYKGSKRKTLDTEIPFGAVDVKLNTENAPGIGYNTQLHKKPEFYGITGEKDFETRLDYMNLCYNKSSRRACEQSLYFAQHLPFSNIKGLLQAVLCVNRFKTLGTDSGDWYLPCQAELYMFTHMQLDGYGEAYKKIDEVRASLGYKPMEGIAPTPCEFDKKRIRVQGFGNIYNSWGNKGDAFSVLAMLRITD